MPRSAEAESRAGQGPLLSVSFQLMFEVEDDEAGLRRGDVIQEVHRQRVTSVSEFNRVARDLGKQPVLLLVNRGETRCMSLSKASRTP